ncbi:TetR/AcrR family transcriptional regulator, partial [Corallococcus terminator]
MARHSLTESEVAEFRARAVAAAEQLFAEHGVDGMTMRGLANMLGCSPMTAYRYFENQEHLVSEVRTSAFWRLA